MLAQALTQLRLDVRTVLSSVLGQRPSPLIRRTRGAHATAPATARAELSLGRPMRVDEVVHETEDTTSLVLADPAGPITFAPGQFFTLTVLVGGERLRRAYSASSAPGALGGRVRVSVKRIPGGRVSNHLVESARPGDVLTVAGPSGSFVPQPATAARHLLLVAGGSGITPLLCITSALLATEPETRVTLLFGNRAERDIPFRDELAALAREHAGRLAIRHVLAEPPPSWDGGSGLLTPEVLAVELDRLAERGELPSASAGPAYLCGPEPMMHAARAALRARGLPDEHIHEEVFASPGARARAAAPAPTGPVDVTFTHAGVTTRAVQRPGKTLLEAGLEAGVDMPYSCAMGGCGACKVQLLSGETTEEGAALTAAERAAGYVLACSDRALRPCKLEVRR